MGNVGTHIRVSNIYKQVEMSTQKLIVFEWINIENFPLSK